MWSFLSKGLLNKELNKYDINEITENSDQNFLWTIQKGKIKASGEDVSIFSFEFKSHSENEIKAAKNSFKRIKTLRHPGILTYLDGFENDSCIYIITPYVEKLSKTLYNSNINIKSHQKFSTNDWGIFKLANLLGFINGDCKMVHNNINPHSIFVDKGGEWKLFGFEYAFNFDDNDAIKIRCLKPKSLRKYEPPESANNYGNNIGEAWSIDIWSFACLIWEIFNGELMQKLSLKDTAKLPKELVPLYCEMMSSNPKARLSPQKFLEKSRSSRNGYLNNPCLSAIIFLDEIQMKDGAEKKKFFTSTLPPLLDSFSADICKHKILPQIVQAFEYCEAGTSILPALIKLGQTISDDQKSYDKLIKPCIVKLYSLPDRHTRIALLSALPDYQNCLTPSVVNDELFNSILTGFLDTNPLVKEATIKAMVYLAPKLNYNNLNVELVKYFARLQGTDPHGGIRTNTTVCMGKIAKYFDPKIRQKILVSAFTRPFRDDFIACRMAGLQAIAATSELYVVKDIGEKVLPSLCSLTLDTDKSIRDLAFEVIEDYLKILKDVTESPEKTNEHDNHAMSSKIAEDQYMPYSPLNSTMQNAYKLGEASKIALGWVSTFTSKLYASNTGSSGNTVEKIAPLDLVSGDITTTSTIKPISTSKPPRQNTTTNKHTSPHTNKATSQNVKELSSLSLNGNGDDISANQNHEVNNDIEEDDEAWEGLDDFSINTKTESFFTAYAEKNESAGQQGKLNKHSDLLSDDNFDDYRGNNKKLANFNEDEWWKTDGTNKSANTNNSSNQSLGSVLQATQNNSNPKKKKNTGDKLLDEILREENMLQKEPIKPRSTNFTNKKSSKDNSRKDADDNWGNWVN